jgi:hypothetical protein
MLQMDREQWNMDKGINTLVNGKMERNMDK